MNRRSPISDSTRAVRLGLGRGPARPLDLGEQLVELLAHLRDRPVEFRPVVADRGRAPLGLARLQQRGQRLGHVVEDAAAALLLGLDRLPALAHATGRPRLGVAEDVRVPADELLVDGARDRVEVAVALLLEQQRQEEDLEQQVAELVVELGRVVGERRVGDLVGLLDRVRDDRARRLLAVPGALGPQAPGQLLSCSSGAVGPLTRRTLLAARSVGLFAGARRVRAARSRRRT